MNKFNLIIDVAKCCNCGNCTLAVKDVSFIRDYRYVRYVVDDAELVRAADVKPAGEGA